MSPADQKILVLERRIDELTAQIRDLQDAVCVSVDPLMKIGFSFYESQIVGLLLKRDSISREGLFFALYGSDERGHCDKAVDVLVSRSRKKCSRFGVKIHSRINFGWWIDQGGKLRLHTAMANWGESTGPVIAKWRAAPTMEAAAS